MTIIKNKTINNIALFSAQGHFTTKFTTSR